MNHTMKVSLEEFLDNASIGQILPLVLSALEEKGYNAVGQLVGYLVSNDPTYITTHKDARSMIKKLELDDILEYLITYYINKSKTNAH